MTYQSPQPGPTEWQPPQQYPHGPVHPTPNAGPYPTPPRNGRFVLGLVIGIISAIVLGGAALVIGSIIYINQTSAGSLGEDATTDGLYAACADGDMGACDDLYMESAFGSDLEEFGATCGGRLDAPTTAYCTDLDL